MRHIRFSVPTFPPSAERARETETDRERGKEREGETETTKGKERINQSSLPPDTSCLPMSNIGPENVYGLQD